MYKNLPGYEGRFLYCMEGLMFDTLMTHATCISITFPFSSTCTHNTGAMATYMKYVKGSIIYKVRAWHRPELWHDRVLDMKLYLLSWMRISITPPPHSLSPSPSCSPFLHPLSFIPRSLSHTSRPPLSLYPPLPTAFHLSFPLSLFSQVPKSIPPWKGVFIEPLACSIHAVERGDVQFEDVVVVSGCGPLGLGMVAAARLKNPKLLIALDLLDWKVGKKCGCHVSKHLCKMSSQSDELASNPGFPFWIFSCNFGEE